MSDFPPEELPPEELLDPPPDEGGDTLPDEEPEPPVAPEMDSTMAFTHFTQSADGGSMKLSNLIGSNGNYTSPVSGEMWVALHSVASATEEKLHINLHNHQDVDLYVRISNNSLISKHWIKPRQSLTVEKVILGPETIYLVLEKQGADGSGGDGVGSVDGYVETA